MLKTQGARAVKHWFWTFGLALSLPVWADTPETFRSHHLDKAIDYVQRLYLYPDEVDAHALLLEAAMGVAREVDWLMVDATDDAVRLRHGDGTFLGEQTVGSLDTLPAAIEALCKDVVASDPSLDLSAVRISALSGMANGLDRYSRILSGERLERFDVRLKGTLVGIGVQLDRQSDGGFLVSRVFPDGPADRAGLVAGDALLRIDGVKVTNMTMRQATERISGDKDTRVVLTVLREGVPVDLPMTRKEVVVPNVESKVLSHEGEPDVGYVRITHFSQRTVMNLERELAHLQEQGALERGLVIDLRQNTGGSMKEAARTADKFLEQGLLLRTAGPDGGRVESLQDRMVAYDDGDEADVPVVVLMDDRTASGSEILAGALLQHDRTVLLGTPSYGKGSVQKIYNIVNNEVRFKLTVAKYVLEGDLEISEGGLQPDLALDVTRFDSRGAHLNRPGTIAGEVVVPWVERKRGWSGEEPDRIDELTEMGRRVALSMKGITRADGLAAIESVAESTRLEQEERLLEVFAERDVNWSASPIDGPAPQVAVTVETSPHPTWEDAWIVSARGTNQGAEALARVQVELSCEGFSAWDGKVIPLGQLLPGQTATGEVIVELRPGIEPREDTVELAVRADKRPLAQAGETVLGVSSSVEPEVRLTARLDGTGEYRQAKVTVKNLSPLELEDLDVYFRHPGDLDVELVDADAVRDSLGPRSDAVFTLGLKVGEVPAALPMNLVVEADRFGLLADWPVALPLDGTPVELRAPRVEVVDLPRSVPSGPVNLSLTARDEVPLDHLLVWHKGRKVAWVQGEERTLDALVELDVEPGTNHFTVVAYNTLGLETRRTFTVRGEAATASVDAED